MATHGVARDPWRIAMEADLGHHAAMVDLIGRCLTWPRVACVTTIRVAFLDGAQQSILDVALSKAQTAWLIRSGVKGCLIWIQGDLGFVKGVRGGWSIRAQALAVLALPAPIPDDAPIVILDA
jgi:hypothetical protein